jgi:signal transduction histidine kinase
MAGSPLDGIMRAVAYRVVEPYGVVVICGIALDDALEPWREVAATGSAMLALVMTVLAVLANIAFRSLRREDDLMADLEERVRERTEQARCHAEDARRANETKTRFLAAASHDLRQPLQAAGMFVEALAARMGDSPHLPVLGKLRQSVDATQALLSTLLDASTLEAGGVVANPAAFPLAPLLASLVDQMEPQAQEAGLSLRMVATGVWVVSDPILLERVLRNLLVNAIRYTETGGVVLGCRRRGDKLAIQVVDTGCGIPSDRLDTVFDDFTRLGARREGASRGLGLGLGVVRRMAALMGHELELRSTLGRGSVFTVVVPVHRPMSSGVDDGNASDLVKAANVAPSTSP